MVKDGIVLGKRYAVLSKIGAGGMADVYKGRDQMLNRYVAIKVLKKQYKEDENFVRKFRSEAQAAAGLIHPNIVNVYDVGEDRGLNYMVMELVEGITLKEYIERKGRLSHKETISIAIQMCSGIGAAHASGIIHRDIKPQNIIISKDGKVKVTDFGIAKAITSNTVSTNAMGSVHYTSPEQARGGIVDEKSDLYSAGITMYEMITGHVPFDGDSTVTVALKHLQEEIKSPAEEVPDIPYSLECIIMKCTQKNPAMRYQSCDELLQDLKHSLVDPEGDFVVLGGRRRSDRTVVMSPEEVERLQRERGYDEDDEYDEDYDDEDDEYDDDYDDEDDEYDDDYDDEDDEDERDRRSSGRGKKKDVNPDTKKIMRILMIVAGVVIALLILFLVGNAVGIFKGSGNATVTQSEKVKVPDVRGMTVEEATKELKKYDLGIDVVDKKPSNEYKKNQIMSQSPGKGEKVKRHSTVEVVLSTGEEAKSTKVPFVIGQDESDAEAAIKAANLVVVKGDPQYSDSVEEGKVISVEPGEGTEVDEGSEVTIVVSLGSQPATVPSIEGKSQSEAESALAAAGLQGSASEEYSDSVAAGIVISQGTASGKQVSKGATVSYVVSKGPKLKVTTVPNILSSNKTTAEKLLQQAGLTAEYLGEDYSDDYPKGQVFYQSVSAGTQVEEGTSIQYMVSKGPQPSDPSGEDGTE